MEVLATDLAKLSEVAPPANEYDDADTRYNPTMTARNESMTPPSLPAH
jgi:hypothetical protein